MESRTLLEKSPPVLEQPRPARSSIFGYLHECSVLQSVLKDIAKLVG